MPYQLLLIHRNVYVVYCLSWASLTTSTLCVNVCACIVQLHACVVYTYAWMCTCACVTGFVMDNLGACSRILSANVDGSFVVNV